MPPGKNSRTFAFVTFLVSEKNRIKSAQSIQTSNLTSDVRRLFVRRWFGFPASIAQLLFYSVHVMIASCEVSIKHKTRVRQKALVLSGDVGRRRMLRNIILTLSTCRPLTNGFSSPWAGMIGHTKHSYVHDSGS